MAVNEKSSTNKNKEVLKITAIILAAGFSRRFNKQKLLMKIGGKSIIGCVIEEVTKSSFEQIILVYRQEEIKQIAKGKDIKTVHNKDAALGISTSIRCGVKKAGFTDAYMFFTGDQPFVNSKAIQKIKTAFYESQRSIVVPRYNQNCGSPVIFAADWKEDLCSLTGDIGGKAIIHKNQDKVFFMDIDDEKVGLDIDTWEDYTLYQKLKSDQNY